MNGTSRLVIDVGGDVDREVVQGGSDNRLDAGEVLVNDTGGGGSSTARLRERGA
jgi:N-methylhydantoinase B